jgi:hypothetical protein
MRFAYLDLEKARKEAAEKDKVMADKLKHLERVEKDLMKANGTGS